MLNKAICKRCFQSYMWEKHADGKLPNAYEHWDRIWDVNRFCICPPNLPVAQSLYVIPENCWYCVEQMVTKEKVDD